MRHLLILTAMVLALGMSNTAYAQNVSKGDVQRLDLDQITLDSTVVTSTGAELNILDGVTATAAEINQAADVSSIAELVTTANTIAATECGKTFFLDSATGFASTLPTPTAGCEFNFIVKTDSTGTYHTIVTTGSETIKGFELNGSITVEGTGSQAADTISFVSSSAVPADRVNLWSDGTSWHSIGYSSASGAIAYSSAI